MTLPTHHLALVGFVSLLLWNASAEEIAGGHTTTDDTQKYLDLYVFSRKPYNNNPGGQFELTGQQKAGFVYSPVLEGRCIPDDETSNTKYWTQETPTASAKDKKLVCHQEYEFSCDKTSPFSRGAQCDEYTRVPSSNDSERSIYVYEAFGYWKNYLLQDWCVESPIPVGEEYTHALSTHTVQFFQYSSTPDGASGCASGSAHGGQLSYGYEIQHVDEPNACWSQEHNRGQTSTCSNSGMLQVQAFPTNHCQSPQKSLELGTSLESKIVSSYSCAEQGHGRLKIETNTCSSPKVYCKSLLGILPEIVPVGDTTSKVTMQTKIERTNKDEDGDGRDEF